MCIQQIQKAAQKKHLDALTDLGLMHQHGYFNKLTGEELIPKDMEKAKSYYQEAAKIGYPKAQNMLGELLL